MNILVPDSWLRDYLKTKATSKQIVEYLSLCSQSVEKVIAKGDDWVYDIEITTNRPDCLSVYGLARELAAILPRFGIKAKLNQVSSIKYQVSSIGNELPLGVKITDPSLCPRFTAIIFEGVKIGPSPKIIQERLAKAEIRALNNVVDISNYLMMELGQPMHTFDYDKIKGAKMILREAKQGERLITLDGQTRILPAGAIIIEDGKNRLIDLCGIMGGENSAVENKTERVLLFVQTYDPAKIRRTCQALGFRTEAASRFEKGVDPEGVIPAINEAIEMFKKNTQAHIVSKLMDIYPYPSLRKIIKLDLFLVNKVIGVEIPKDEITGILKSLGFLVFPVTSQVLSITVPPWRNGDVSIPEDLIEEIARIYGYHRLSGTLPPGMASQPKDIKFLWEERVKTCLKYWGLTEVVSYSLVSRDFLTQVGLEPEDYLKLTNPLTDDLVYLRPTLIPSILQTFSQNQANFKETRIFEVANVYIPQGEGELPEEISMLTGGQTGKKFFEVKGLLEALFEDLGIRDYGFDSSFPKSNFFSPGKSAQIIVKGKPIGFLGEIESQVSQRFEIPSKVILFDLELTSLINHASPLKHFEPLPAYPPTIEDLTFIIPGKVEVNKIMQTIKAVNRLIVKVELLDSFNNTQTFRIYCQSPFKTLSGEETAKVREKIIKKVEEKFGASLKGQSLSSS